MFLTLIKLRLIVKLRVVLTSFNMVTRLVVGSPALSRIIVSTVLGLLKRSMRHSGETFRIRPLGISLREMTALWNTPLVLRDVELNEITVPCEMGPLLAFVGGNRSVK